MRKTISNAILFFVLSTLVCQVCFSEPMVIDINEGMEEMPYQVGDVELESTSSFVETILVNDQPKTRSSLGEVIEKRTGIKIRQNQGQGSYALASIRGKAADQVKIYVDGVPLNSAGGGGVDLSLIPLNEIGAIEVYKDIVPIEFPEASNGGVINIKTHRPNNNEAISLKHMIGSFSTSKTDIKTQATHHKLKYYLAFGNYTSKNDFSYIADGETKKRNNNSLDQKNFISHVNVKINNSKSLILQTEYLDKEKGLPSWNNHPSSRSSISNTGKTLSANYFGHFLSENNRFQLKLSQYEKSLLYDNRYGENGVGAELNQYDSNNQLASFYLKSKYNYFDITMHSQLRKEIFTVDKKLISNNENQNNERITRTIALQASTYNKRKTIVVSPAIRYQQTNDNIHGLVLTRDSKKLTGNSRLETVSPQIGARFISPNGVVFKTNIAKYYRNPSYIELFGSRGYIGANNDLKPEEGINSDFGFEYEFFPTSSAITRLRFQPTIFHSIIDNEIVYSATSQGISIPKNTTRSTITGFENQFNIEFFYRFDFTHNLTLLDATHVTENNYQYNLPGRPMTSSATTLSASWNEITGFVEHILDKDMYFDTVNRQPSSDKNIINIGGNFDYKYFSVDFSIINILNQNYKDFYNTPSPGRFFRLSTHYTFT